MDPELESPQIPLQPKLLSRSEILLRRTLLLTVVVILSGVSSFFIYQNLQLQKQIMFLQNPPISPIPLISPTPTCTPLPSCAYNTDRDGAMCKIGENPPKGGVWCPRYVCPSNDWVNCMPILDETKKKACSPEAMTWYKTNCPNFQGGAL